MDENNRIAITVCGDGGCGMLRLLLWGSRKAETWDLANV
jgi:hypothetical protein